MLRFGPLTVDPPLVLAPMAGITDHLYRLMLRRVGGVGLVTMEFISSEAITRGNARQLAKLYFSDEERPLSIQIYGSDPDRMAAAAEIVEELRPDACDINMGCPANKVLKGCAGAALMGDLPLARCGAGCRFLSPSSSGWGWTTRAETSSTSGRCARTKALRRSPCTLAPPVRCTRAAPIGGRSRS